MKSTDTDILIIPGYEGSEPDHWQSRMVARLSSARAIEQSNWLFPSLDVAVDELAQTVRDSTKPVVFVAHSAGTILMAHAVKQLQEERLIERVKGAYLVSVPSPRELAKLPFIDKAFTVIPRDPLPFPSILVASSNDPFSTFKEAADIALAWGSQFVEAGEAGHINTASGHGPWPEGMMRFAGFLSKL